MSYLSQNGDFQFLNNFSSSFLGFLKFLNLLCGILSLFMVLGFIQKRRETGSKTLWQPGKSKVPIPAEREYPPSEI